MGKIEELLYVDSNEYIKDTLKIVVIGISLMFFTNGNIAIKVYETIFLIASIVVLLLIFSRINTYHQEFFQEAAWIFFSIAIFNLNTLLLIISNKGINSVVIEFINKSFLWKIGSIIIGITFIIDYIEAEKRDIRKNIMKIGVITIYGYTNMIIGSKIIKITMVILLICYSLEYIKKLKITPVGKINYLKVFLIILMIRAIGNLFWECKDTPYELCRVIKIINFTIGLGFMWNFAINIIKAPLYKEKNKLSVLKREVVKLNENLKEKQVEIINEKSVRSDNFRFFKSFFRNIPIPIITLAEDNTVVYINKPGLEIMGLKNIKEIWNKNIQEFISTDEKIMESRIGEVSREGIVKTNGKNINIEIKKGLEKNGEFILVLTDLTSERENERIKNDLAERDMQENLKRKFLANISHDLKTPINVIYSSIQVQDIYIENNNIEELRKQQDISKHNCLGLKRLTNNIIDIGKIDSGFLEKNVETGNIVNFIEDIVLGLVDYAKMKGIEIIFDTSDEELYINFNKSYMERVILNLITNAIKYNRVDGKIFVCIINKKNKVEIVVEDTGIGIKREYLDRVFERYFKDGETLSKEFKSSGIGLYVVKKLVEAQRGKICIDSIFGRGTTVKMVFSGEQNNNG